MVSTTTTMRNQNDCLRDNLPGAVAVKVRVKAPDIPEIRLKPLHSKFAACSSCHSFESKKWNRPARACERDQHLYICTAQSHSTARARLLLSLNDGLQILNLNCVQNLRGNSVTAHPE
ncbi:uncharacterized protein PHALS_03705 [Plasmopara halstedii]|uniref:Uncharacterized protein n=1 Tax=Plasmopara halstedii TaxID=4781 RepID=A0A0P1AY96_PLAHL|nr:uncharacterized protein PHALS_03705 [Plasmopara halstedii]CEG47042.1 hypothetical protein PHALS_03705 [Plasmopara halstedii]|eukprot:XP_024583411.1 hypothetical protein PHALS_03705 [Plasmopara halstedii]